MLRSYRVIQQYIQTVQGDEWSWRVEAISDELPRPTFLPISFARREDAEESSVQATEAAR
jgi:hypothetical protein